MKIYTQSVRRCVECPGYDLYNGNEDGNYECADFDIDFSRSNKIYGYFDVHDGIHPDCELPGAPKEEK